MEQSVYLDIYFLINFSMDFLGLFLSARLVERKIKYYRLIIAASVGALYACLTLFISLAGLWRLLLDALVCLAIGAVAVFDRRALKGVPYFSLVFGAVSIILGGAMTALFHLFNRLGVDLLFDNGGDGDGVSVWLFAILAGISGLLALKGGGALKKRAIRKRGRIEIEYAGGRTSISCLCDSGNLLREPISSLPCVLVELDALSSVLPRSLTEAVKKGNITLLEERERARVRLIPSQSATGKAMLVGLRVDALRIDMGGGAVKTDAYVVLLTEKISEKGIKALVPSEIAFGAA